MARYTIDFYAKHLARRVNVSLVIPSLNLHETLNNKNPSYYQDRKEQYPLAIFLCGFGDNKEAWLRNTNIDSLCEKNKIAGLFIDGENKWYLNQGAIDDHYHFIEEDLLDFVYGNFTCLSKEMPLIIAGVSMGGYGAMYHYLTNTDKYKACIALSPAVKPDFLDETKFGSLRDHFLANKDKELNVYLAIGENDFIIGQSREFNDFLINHVKNVEYKFVPKKDHSWDFWREEIYPIFDYLKSLGIIGRSAA